MPENLPSSSWVEKLSPNAARAALGALLVIAGILVWVALGITEPIRRAGPSDLDTYERVVTALRTGQSYYPALHQALLDGGYGTLSPLNWRTPPFLTLLSWFPTLAAAQLALGLLTVGAWGLAVAYIHRIGGVATAVGAGVVMAASLVGIAAPRAELSYELCAGTLLLISVSGYGLGWRWLGIAAALLALFVRELSVLYVVVCLVFAVRDRRWTETGLWVAGLAGYAAFYLWHVQQVAALIGPTDHAAEGWLQLGGPVFLLRTAAFDGVLLVAPYWVAALVLVVGLVGLKGLPRPGLAVVLYLLLFLFYGRPENDYWGALYAPLLALGVVVAPASFAALVARATRRRWSAAEPGDAPRSGSSPPSADGSAR